MSLRVIALPETLNRSAMRLSSIAILNRSLNRIAILMP